MKTPLFLSFVLVALSLASCVPSLHPIFSEENLDFDEALVGKWSKEDADSTWHFVAEDNTTYLLTLSDGKTSGRFHAALVKVGDNRYLNIFPAEIDAEEHRLNGLYAWLLVPSHTFLKVRQIEPELQMSFLNYDAVEALLEEHPEAVSHTVTNERIVFTASTEELQSFFKKHDKDDSLFKDYSKLRKRAD